MLKQLQERTTAVVAQSLAGQVISFILQEPWDRLYCLGMEVVTENSNYSKKDRHRYLCEYPLLRNELSYSLEFWQDLMQAFKQVNARALENLIAIVYAQFPERKDMLVETEDCTMSHAYNSLLNGLNGMHLTLEDIFNLDGPAIKIYRRKRKAGHNIY